MNKEKACKDWLGFRAYQPLYVINDVLFIYIYIYIYIYAVDEDMVSHVPSHVVWWKKKNIYIYIYIYMICKHISHVNGFKYYYLKVTI